MAAYLCYSVFSLAQFFIIRSKCKCKKQPIMRKGPNRTACNIFWKKPPQRKRPPPSRVSNQEPAPNIEIKLPFCKKRYETENFKKYIKYIPKHHQVFS